MKKRLCIVIPVYNEEKVILDVIRELKKNGYKNIIVVDDGSGDNTYGKVCKAGVVTIRHRMNRGKGAAVKTGIEAAKLLNADIVVTFDGDGQHDPKDIARMLSYIRKGYDVVLGTRFTTKQDIPLYKRWLNYLGNVMAYVMYGIWVTDSQSGLRAYRKKAFFTFDTLSDRYEFDTEVLREIHNHSLSYIEMPMRVRYTAYSQQKEYRQNFVSAILTAVKLMLSS